MEAAQLTREAIDGPWLEGGGGWRDQATRCWIAASTPEAEPVLWDQYLEGALRSYRRHGLEWVLDLDAIRDGADTAMFFAAAIAFHSRSLRQPKPSRTIRMRNGRAFDTGRGPYQKRDEG